MAFADSEKLRFVDRVRAITFREARDAGASFISRSWIATRIKRSETFVKRNWMRNPYDCEMDTEPIGVPRALSLESREIIHRECGKPRRSIRNLVKILEEERGKEIRMG